MSDDGRLEFKNQSPGISTFCIIESDTIIRYHFLQIYKKGAPYWGTPKKKSSVCDVLFH